MKKILVLSVAAVAAMFAYSATLTCEALRDYDGGAMGSVAITVNGCAFTSGGDVLENATVSITAKAASTDAPFVQWVGVPDGVTATDNTITFTMGTSDMTITPVLKGMWIFDKTENLIRGAGNDWVVKAKVANETKHYLQLGTTKKMNYVSGTVTVDFSTPICSTDGQQWIATTTHEKGLGVGYVEGVSEGLPKKLILPKTLTSVGSQFLHSAKDTGINANMTTAGESSLTNIVFDCPELTVGLDAWTFCVNTKLESLYLNCPLITYISYETFTSMNGSKLLCETDVSTWNLASVEKLGVKSDSPTEHIAHNRGAFRDLKFNGTMKLPKVQYVGDSAFYNTANLNGAEFGTDGFSLKYVGTNVFDKSGIKKLVFAGAEGWTMFNNSVTFAKNLSEVVFLSTPPTIADGTLVNGTDATRPYSCCFYIPKDDASWDEILEDATAVNVNDANYMAFIAAHPTATPPAFVLAANSALGNSEPQYVAYVRKADYGIGTRVTTSFYDDRFGVGTVSVLPTPARGVYEPGDEVTITVTDIPEGMTMGSFYKVPKDAVINGNQVTFVVGNEDIDARVNLAPAWTYYAADGVISNKIWRLKVYTRSAKDGTTSLGVGKSDSSDDRFSADGDMGEGVLDMSGKVFDENGDEWRITAIGKHAFRVDSNDASAANGITSFIFPRTIEYVGLDAFTDAAGHKLLQEVIFDVPNIDINISGQIFNCNHNLTNVLFRIPKTTQLGERIFINNTKLASDVSEWRLDAVTKVNKQFFGEVKHTKFNVHGTLKLPALTEIGLYSVGRTGISAIELGTAYTLSDKKTLALGDYSFATNTSLTTLTFGPYAAITSASGTAFAGCTKINSLVFEGAAIARDTLDDILQEVEYIADQDTPVVIYASEHLGWKRIEGFIALAGITDSAELAKKPSGNVIGVYQTQDNVKKAWIIHRKSEFDPKGTIVIIR